MENYERPPVSRLAMWHEQRKQEKAIKGMMVDRRRRAERRRDYWERIRADPNQFLQIHGRSIKIHLDPSIAMAADSPATMMPEPTWTLFLNTILKQTKKLS